MQIDFLDFHGKELSLKLRSDGNMGSLESSSGNLANMDCFEVSLTWLYGLVAFHLSGYSYYVLGIVHYNFGKIGFPENHLYSILETSMQIIAFPWQRLCPDLFFVYSLVFHNLNLKS